MSTNIDDLLQELDDESLSSKDKKSYEKRISQLEKEIEDQQKIIHKLRKPRITIRPGETPKRTKDQFIRLIYGDTHGCCIDPTAAAAFYADVEVLKPKQIIHLGDAVDCGGFLAQHHTLGYVAESEYSYEDDCIAGNEHFDMMQKLCPNAEWHVLEGNHERRVEKWCVNQTLKNGKDAETLRQLYAPNNRLHYDTRGFNFYRQTDFYHDLKTRGTIKLGHCYFTHGHRHGKHAAMAMVQQFGGNIVFGDTHRIQSHTIKTVHNGVAVGWTIGCLRTLQPHYRNADMTDHVHGYAIQLVNADGTFIMLQNYIMDGKSLIVPFLKTLSL